eukprot:358487-Chlamydomonas_euryale.AAC.5
MHGPTLAVPNVRWSRCACPSSTTTCGSFAGGRESGAMGPPAQVGAGASLEASGGSGSGDGGGASKPSSSSSSSACGDGRPASEEGFLPAGAGQEGTAFGSSAAGGPDLHAEAADAANASMRTPPGLGRGMGNACFADQRPAQRQPQPQQAHVQADGGQAQSQPQTAAGAAGDASQSSEQSELAEQFYVQIATWVFR